MTLSGALAGLALATVSLVHSRAPSPQLIVLTGLVGLVLAAHGVSVWLARRRQYALAIWLVACAQILVTCLTVLLLDDFWAIGIFLLAVIPLEIGVADHLRRMPAAIVLSLIGAAGMMIADLAWTGERIRLLSLFPSSMWLAVGFVVVHLAGLGMLLFSLRLLPASPYHTPLDLTTQQTLVLTLISAGSIALVTSVLIAQLRASQIEQVGFNLETLARINAGEVGKNLDPSIFRDSQAKALAEMTRSTKVASLAGLATVLLVVLAAIFSSRVIARPIEDLTKIAAAISTGDLDQRAEPAGPVEMVTLAEAFNTLTTRLRDLISSLQDQVAHRTAQLEARAQQLSTLNRINQAVSSVQELPDVLKIVAREMVLLFNIRNSGIALLDEKRTTLTIVADYTQSETYPSTMGIVIPVIGNESSEQVIRTAQPIVIPHPRVHPLTRAIHSLMEERGSECLMIVPLLARGEVIGTIGLTSAEPGRIFTEAEVALAQTIAGQIAGAIENARLFSETLKAREAAETANQTKSDFLANISHELRTPLTSILGFARINQKRLMERIFPAIQDPDPRLKRTMEQVNENIEIIIAEGDRLTSLINDVLDLAKIEAGKVEWQVQPLQIADVIEHAIASTASLFEGKGLALVNDIPEGLPPIEGDRDRLIQVVINLLSNAVKFTPQGSVTCRARVAGPSDPSPTGGPTREESSGRAEIIVSVIDTGIGIDPEDQPRVFEKFTQVGDTLTGKPRGTGLGLPICKEIIEHHGGRIWVESIPNRGSAFSFSLPVNIPTGGISQGSGDIAGAPGHSSARPGPETDLLIAES